MRHRKQHSRTIVCWKTLRNSAGGPQGRATIGSCPWSQSPPWRTEGRRGFPPIRLGGAIPPNHLVAERRSNHRHTIGRPRDLCRRLHTFPRRSATNDSRVISASDGRRRPSCGVLAVRPKTRTAEGGHPTPVIVAIAANGFRKSRRLLAERLRSLGRSRRRRFAHAAHGVGNAERVSFAFGSNQDSQRAGDTQPIQSSDTAA